MSIKKVIIIGAGLGGLAAAIRLRKKNYQVVVYDTSHTVGGKTKSISQDGFTWGFGASLLTLPHYIDELFLLCNKNPKDYYSYKKLDPVCKYFFSDSTTLETHASKEKLLEEFHYKLNEPKKNIENYLDNIDTIFKHTEHIFLRASLQKWATYFNLKTLKSIFNLWKIGLFNTMFQKNSKRFLNEKTIQLFNRYATYNGSNPYRTPATMNVIAAPEYLQGGFIMEKGMPQVSQAIYKLALEEGIEFVFDTKVDEIFISNNKATGVKINNKIIDADIVVSNVDVHFTYHHLLPNTKKPEHKLNQERSTSAIIFYWGMSKVFDKLDVHNIMFSEDYAQEFAHIEKGEVYNDATIYIFISSKAISGHAPQGMENWFALVNIPHNTGQDWETQVDICRKQMQSKISKHLGEDIAPYIISEYVNSPETIERDTLSFAGSLYGPSSNNKMSAFMRHPNFSNDIKNLYFAGGSVHPGGGVPLCLMSGKIVADLVE
jgi:phytoene desaturase